MADPVVINAVTLTPSTVNTGQQFIISVDIYVVYPTSNLYPASNLYPTSDNGSVRP